MDAGKGFTPNVAFALTGDTSSFASDDKQNESSSLSDLWPLVTSTFESHELNLTVPLRWVQADLLCPSAQPSCLYPCQDGDVPVQDTSRQTPGLLDTRIWSPSPHFATPCATSGTIFSSTMIGYDASLASLDVVSNAFPGSFVPIGTSAHGIAPEPQVVLHSQARPDLSSTHHHAYLSTDLNRPIFPTHAMPSSLSSTGAAQFAGNGEQPSLVLYHTPKSSGRRRCQRACAIDIEGLWIDKDDLRFVASQGSSIISVHECQWDKSSDPCGVWIIGSRARVGTHVRKWHRRSHGDSRVKCLWNGCTARKMLKDSISRHVVTVHLGEGFHCQGCNQEFSRKDVYDEHVGNSEACLDASVAVVYGTDCRMIDTRKALQQGAPVRFAGR